MGVLGFLRKVADIPIGAPVYIVAARYLEHSRSRYIRQLRSGTLEGLLVYGQSTFKQLRHSNQSLPTVISVSGNRNLLPQRQGAKIGEYLT